MTGARLLAQGRRPIARGAVLSVLLMGFGSGVGYAIQIFISRTLGAEEYGSYAYVLGLLNIVRTVVTLSFDMAALRFASNYYTEADWPLFRGFLWASRGTVGLLSLTGALLCGGVSLIWRDQLPPGLLRALLAGCVLLTPSSLITLEVALLQALRSVYAARIPNVFLRPIVLSAVLASAVYGYHLAATAALALAANTVGTVLALLVSLWFLRKLVPSDARFGSRVLAKRQWSLFCVANLGQNLVYLLLSQQADIVLVGSLVSTRDAGFYAAASQISTLCLLGVNSVNQFVAPILAGFHDQRSDNRLKQLLARIMLLNAVLSLPLIFAVIALGPFLLGLFGSPFQAAYPVIVVLTLGSLFNALWGGLWGDLLTMTGFQNESAVIVVAVTTLNLALTVVLTPRLGMVGAAYATAAAVFVRSALVALVVRRRLGFFPWTVLRHAAP